MFMDISGYYQSPIQLCACFCMFVLSLLVWAVVSVIDSEWTAKADEDSTWKENDHRTQQPVHRNPVPVTADSAFLFDELNCGICRAKQHLHITNDKLVHTCIGLISSPHLLFVILRKSTENIYKENKNLSLWDHFGKPDRDQWNPPLNVPSPPGVDPFYHIVFQLEMLWMFY